MPMLTTELNPDEKRCDSAHEAGHAAVGILRGLQLKKVVGVEVKLEFPQCEWELDAYKEMLTRRDDEGVVESLDEFTRAFAVTALASRYSEALCCDTTSYEQQLAFNGDRQDAQAYRTSCGFGPFDDPTIESLDLEARDLVALHADTIVAITERLRAKEILSHEDIAAILGV